MRQIMDWLVDHWFVIVLAILVTTVVCAAYDEMIAEKFYLRKDSWACTKAHAEVSTVPITISGGYMVLVPETHNICDQWSRSAP